MQQNPELYEQLAAQYQQEEQFEQIPEAMDEEETPFKNEGEGEIEDQEGGYDQENQQLMANMAEQQIEQTANNMMQEKLEDYNSNFPLAQTVQAARQ